MALLYIEPVSGHHLAIGRVRYMTLLLGVIRDVRIVTNFLSLSEYWSSQRRGVFAFAPIGNGKGNT